LVCWYLYVMDRTPDIENVLFLPVLEVLLGRLNLIYTHVHVEEVRLLPGLYNRAGTAIYRSFHLSPAIGRHTNKVPILHQHRLPSSSHMLCHLAAKVIY
jgi:hypothetical protein